MQPITMCVNTKINQSTLTINLSAGEKRGGKVGQRRQFTVAIGSRFVLVAWENHAHVFIGFARCTFIRASNYPSQVAHIRLEPGFHSMKKLGVFLLPLDGMLVHRRVTRSSKFADTHLYTWAERGTMRVKCLAQENNAVPRSARAWTRIARSGVQRNNH